MSEQDGVNKAMMKSLVVGDDQFVEGGVVEEQNIQ